MAGAGSLLQNPVMYTNGSSNMMIGGNNSATTISNKSTSAGGTVGLWKNSSKLMRDPDQIGSQMMNGNKLGTNNSSSIFGGNGLINGSAAGSSSNAKQMQ